MFCKNSTNRGILSALLMAIVCFESGRWVRGFVETKILNQHLTLLNFLVIRQTQILFV